MWKNFHRRIHHYTIPHETNNYKARTIQNTAVLFYIFLFIFLSISKNIVRQSNILGFATDITTERIIELVNEKRKEANLVPLTSANELQTAATQKAADMFTKNYWAHISPVGVTPWTYITSAGYDYIYAGENLARSFDKSEEVVEAWMNSPTHKANLLKPEYTEIGVAVMNGKLNGEETTLVVQEFGSRSKSTAQVLPGQQNPQIAIVPTFVPPAKSGYLDLAAAVDFKAIQLPFKLSKTLSLILVEILLIILFIDSIYIAKNKVYRISGHSLAHIIFFLALLGAMGATGVGAIL